MKDVFDDMTLADGILFADDSSGEVRTSIMVLADTYTKTSETNAENAHEGTMIELFLYAR